MVDPILSIEGLHKAFGGLQAVRDVSFSLQRGQVLGLIGPNGAGKTTIFNLINGIYRLDAGRVRLGPEDITDLGPAVIARRGIARTFQVPRTFNGMTVAENLLVPLIRLGVRGAESWRRTGETLSRLSLSRLSDKPASELSGGQRKLLELGRALMTAPKVLILDEPFSGASADVVELTLELIKEHAAQGIGCLVISHDIVSMPRLCDEVIVLVSGSVLTRGLLDDVRRDPSVIDAYLGY